MFDLHDIRELDEASIEIKHPVTGAPTGIVLTLAGPEHPKRRQLVFDRLRQKRAKMQKTGKLLQFDDPEDEFEEDLDFLAACTLGWKGLFEKGEEVPFSYERARALYQKHGWLRAQARAALEERENFIATCAHP